MTTPRHIQQQKIRRPATDRSYLDLALRRLRLLLSRRVLWLRRQWKGDNLQNYRGLVIGDQQADRLLSGMDGDAEQSFYSEDEEAGAFTRSIEAVEAQLVRWETSPLPAPLEVAKRFGLSDFERDLLILCLATELDPAFARLYAYCQDDVNKQYATGELAASLFDMDDTDAAERALAPDSPLRRYRLVVLGEPAVPAAPRVTRPLELDERIRCELLNIDSRDDRLVGLLRYIHLVPVPPGHRALAAKLADQMARAESHRINLTGPHDAGKSSVAVLMCHEAHLKPMELRTAALPAGGNELEECIRLLDREARLADMAVYVDAEEPDASPAMKDLAERFEGLLVLGSRKPWQSLRGMIEAEVQRPGPSEQRDLWLRALGTRAAAAGADIEQIVEHFDFGPEAIARAAARARFDSHGNALWASCRRTAASSMDGLATEIRSAYEWEDIVLPPDSQRQLHEIAGQVAARARVYESWGFGKKLARGRGISALFCGSSGTGKTMAAEVLATHLDLDLYRIDLAGVINKYIGQTEKNLRKVFEAAEQSGVILFFDEADALFGKRTDIKDSHDRYANIEVDYLLQRMEDYRGLAILATNRRSALDRALLRRLRFVVEFPFPDFQNRRLIWKKVFPERAELGNLDYDALARLEVAGGNIRNIALNGAFLAAEADVPIGMDHLMHAARREYAKIDKMLTGVEFSEDGRSEKGEADG